MRVGFVFVTCRPDTVFNCISSYVDNAIKYNHQFDIILIEDSVDDLKPELLDKLRTLKFPFSYYTHKLIDTDLGPDAWIFPHNSGACRGYGFLKSYARRHDMMLTVDDVVYATDDDFVGLHWKALCQKGDGKWYNPFNNITKLEEFYSRGFPYNSRATTPVVLNQGIQLVGPDVDSVTLKKIKAMDGVFPWIAGEPYNPWWMILPIGVYTTIAYTSVAIKYEAIPAYYTQLMGEDIYGHKINRFDDIWSGLFLKKIADHMGHTISHGKPITEHRKVARPLINDLNSEKRGIEIMDQLWQVVDKIQLTQASYVKCYKELANEIEKRSELLVYPDYIKKNCEAMRVWCRLIKERNHA